MPSAEAIAHAQSCLFCMTYNGTELDVSVDGSTVTNGTAGLGAAATFTGNAPDLVNGGSIDEWPPQPSPGVLCTNPLEFDCNGRLWLSPTGCWNGTFNASGTLLEETVAATKIVGIQRIAVPTGCPTRCNDVSFRQFFKGEVSFKATAVVPEGGNPAGFPSTYVDTAVYVSDSSNIAATSFGSWDGVALHGATRWQSRSYVVTLPMVGAVGCAPYINFELHGWSTDWLVASDPRAVKIDYEIKLGLFQQDFYLL